MIEVSRVHIGHHQELLQCHFGRENNDPLRYGALSSNVSFKFPQQQVMMINDNNNITIVGGSNFDPFIRNT